MGSTLGRLLPVAGRIGSLGDMFLDGFFIFARFRGGGSGLLILDDIPDCVIDYRNLLIWDLVSHSLSQ